MGIDPLVLALDTNPAFLNMIRVGGCQDDDIHSWDLNNVEDAKNKLPDLIALAKATGRPVIIDLPAKGGETLGVYTLMRTGALRQVTIIGIATLTQNDLTVIGAIEAHEIIKPSKWIQVEFGNPKKRADPRPETVYLQKLAALAPDDKILLEELHESEARELSKTPPVPYDELERYADSVGLNACQWYVIADYWNDAKPKIIASLQKVAPEIFEPPALESGDLRDEATSNTLEERAPAIAGKAAKTSKSQV
jgi:hypothetical protein